jgi:hypothetical protein
MAKKKKPKNDRVQIIVLVTAIISLINAIVTLIINLAR